MLQTFKEMLYRYHTLHGFLDALRTALPELRPAFFYEKDSGKMDGIESIFGLKPREIKTETLASYSNAINTHQRDRERKLMAKSRAAHTMEWEIRTVDIGNTRSVARLCDSFTDKCKHKILQSITDTYSMDEITDRRSHDVLARAQPNFFKPGTTRKCGRHWGLN